MAMRAISTGRGLLGGRGAMGVLKAFQTRPMATEATASPSVKVLPMDPLPPPSFAYRKAPTVLATIHKFPSLEPSHFEAFPSNFLHAPLRRDILHRAVIFEGDCHRFGLASTKTRREIHGSGHKLRPQKGTGRARLGDKSSPMLRGGAVSHGPRPRDFATKLPRKMYDMAWRNALSYRYRRGQLVVVEGELEVAEAEKSLVLSVLRAHGWGNEGGRSLLITRFERHNLKKAMADLGAEGRVLTVGEVDVKDLLEMGRIVIEKEALLYFQEEHSEE
ncbi:ribosomal protein L4 domain-containing protein [Morchella snyderi]|nr:ribosomal protein L4 domain-containing protein [Morchella snyderi]